MGAWQPTFGEPITDWFRWFAWRPIHTLDRGWRWLRPVWRRRCLIHGYLDNRGQDMWFQHVVTRPEREATR